MRRIEPIASACTRVIATPRSDDAIFSRRSGICGANGWSAGMRNRRAISFWIASSRVFDERISLMTSSMSQTA